LRPLGQIHDSFIIAAGRDGLWIIDQHVAHERILFEQVLAARSRGAVVTQRLLIPAVIGLTLGIGLGLISALVRELGATQRRLAQAEEARSRR